MSAESTPSSTRRAKVQAQLGLYYGELARELASQPDRPHSVPLRQEEFRAIIDKVVVDSSRKRILELACGVGFWTKRIATNARSVLAIDFSPVAIQVAREGSSGPHVEFAVQDVFAIDIGARQFDLVFAGFLLSHIRREDLSVFFSKLHSVVPMGTRLMFIDNARADRTLRPLVSVDRNGNAFERRALRGGAEHSVLKNYYTDQELRLAIGNRVDELQVDRRDHYYIVSYTNG
jgi:demethylmenaquinone methyltransferase/2-methoxy-6-polyprenyl-1,4-benzoquinol methylase